MRVELARLLLTRPDLLLLDEPTNHLDIESILWFIQYLKDYEGTVMVVSHDQHFLDRATLRTFEVEMREIRDYPFPYHKAMTLKQEQRGIRESAYENQQRQIAHKERLIEKFRAKASKAKFAKSLQTELDRMDIVELEGVDSKAMRLRFEAGARSGKVVYKMHRLKKTFGPKVVIKDFDFAIDKGSRIAFVGQNGQGKTTLAKIMAGVHTLDGGELEIGANVALGYYAQDQPDNIPMDKRVIDVLREAAPIETEGRLRSVLGSLLFSGDDVEKKCSVLSGGERARLAFACMILTPSNVLILDEPTNHLDIQSKDILKRALQEYAGTLIVVSHDVYFLGDLTTTTLEFTEGKISHHLYDINEFLERRQVENLDQLELKKKAAPPVKESPKPDNSRERKALQRQIQNLEKQIERLETEKGQLESEMAIPDFYMKKDSEAKTQRYDVILKELEEKTTEWESGVSEFERLMS
jgi:ATP-binding cassette subfamily F protein 3